MDKNKLEKILDEIRPALQAHGGDIELIDFNKKEKIVKVKLIGGCASCPMAALTLREVVEQAIKEKIPEIKKVEAA